jgi:uncharacterized protein (TIGR02231 family)
MRAILGRALTALAVGTTGTCIALAAEIEAASRIDTVTVYPDGATVTRIIEADLPAGDSTLLAADFPLTLDSASLRVEGAGRLVIGSVDARRPRPQPTVGRPDIEKRIEALRDERALLDDRIGAAAARRKFAETFAAESPKGIGEKGEARPLSEWRAAFAAVADEVAAADTITREAKLRQRDIDREIARFAAETKATPPRKMEVRIDLAAEAPTRASLKISYSVRGARWSPLYDARLDTGTKERKPALELTRRAEIMQQTGEDWSDVALAVSTVRTAKGGNAPELASLVVKYPEPPRPMAKAAEGMRARTAAPAGRPDSLAAVPPPPAAPAQEREAAIEAGGFQVVFRIPGRISVAVGEGSRSLRIASQKIAPDLLVRASPALDDAAYLEAAFKQSEEAPLLPGRVAVYRDGTFVGRGTMQLVPKDETVRLGFGVDEKVKVARGGQEIRGHGRHHFAFQDRRARVQDHGAQRPRRADRDHGGGPDPGERDRRRAGRAVAGEHAAYPARCARSPRRARLELHGSARRAARDQARLAGALAGRQDHRVRVGEAVRRVYRS